LRFSSTCVLKRTRNQIILIILVTVIIFLIDKTVDGNGGFFAGYFSDILVDIAKKGRIVDERERTGVEAGQTEKWKANILAMRT